MIGTSHFENLCALYFAMIGLIWTLVDSVYHIIKPRESSEKHVSDTSAAERSLENLTGKNDYIQESFKIHPSEAKSDSISIRGDILELRQSVNLEVHYLSKQKLTSARRNVLPRKRLLKKTCVESRCLPCEVVPCNNEKVANLAIVKNSQHNELLLKKTQVETKCMPCKVVPSNEETINLIIVKKSFNPTNELKNNLVFSIREITKLISIDELAVAKENSLLLTSSSPVEYNRSELIGFTIEDIVLKNSREKRNPFSDQIYEHSGIRIKRDNNQILSLRKTAHYIINQMDIEIKSHLKKQFDEMEISDFFDINKSYSDLCIEQRNKYLEPNIIITEPDSSDEMEALMKQKTQRKKNRKSKFNIQNVESNSATFSSKQCFERLAFFMNTNQKLTRSKMMFEIEKEMKPIKDRISELRESMIDFVVVKEQTNAGLVKTRFSVEPLNRDGIRLKSILTTPSVSLLRLAQLADTSNNLQALECPEIIERVPKKLSHLAEMYVKLSRQ